MLLVVIRSERRLNSKESLLSALWFVFHFELEGMTKGKLSGSLPYSSSCRDPFPFLLVLLPEPIENLLLITQTPKMRLSQRVVVLDGHHGQ